nr:immunoglobulin heavy chain junction region [Mus musculus]
CATYYGYGYAMDYW